MNQSQFYLLPFSWLALGFRWRVSVARREQVADAERLFPSVKIGAAAGTPPSSASAAGSGSGPFTWPVRTNFKGV